MKTSAQNAYKSASMIKKVEGPWSAEKAVAYIKNAAYQFRQNTMQKPRKDRTLAVTDVTGDWSTSGTEKSFPTTEAFPWDNQHLDNMTGHGDSIS
jgi:hypothetical protein